MVKTVGSLELQFRAEFPEIGTSFDFQQQPNKIENYAGREEHSSGVITSDYVPMAPSRYRGTTLVVQSDMWGWIFDASFICFYGGCIVLFTRL